MKLDRNTATWRFLEITRLIAEFVQDQPANEDMKRLVQQANDVLKQTGPAEIIRLEQYFSSHVEASWASDDQTLTPEERTRGCSHFIELWTAQMEQSFPRVPLYCQTFATKSAGSEREIDPNKIDLEHLRRLLLLRRVRRFDQATLRTLPLRLPPSPNL